MVRLIHLNPDAPGFNDGLVLVKSTRLSATIPEREKKKRKQGERERQKESRKRDRKKERKTERKKEKKMDQ